MKAKPYRLNRNLPKLEMHFCLLYVPLFFLTRPCFLCSCIEFFKLCVGKSIKGMGAGRSAYACLFQLLFLCSQVLFLRYKGTWNGRDTT